MKGDRQKRQKTDGGGKLVREGQKGIDRQTGAEGGTQGLGNERERGSEGAQQA